MYGRAARGCIVPREISFGDVYDEECGRGSKLFDWLLKCGINFDIVVIYNTMNIKIISI